MTNRVLLGNRNGAYGLWVSKPGYDVANAGTTDANMLFVPSAKTVRVIQSGTISVPASSSPFSQTVTFAQAAPAKSGVLAGTLLASTGKMIEGNGTWFSYSQTSTGATFVKSSVTVAFTIYWSLLTEVGGL